MSLINEALKKAQKQRQEEAARPGDPGQAEPPPPPIPPKAPPASPFAPEPDPVPVRQIRRDHASGGRGKLIVIGGGVLAILVIGWWALTGSDAPVEVALSPDTTTDLSAREVSSESLAVTSPSVVERGKNTSVEPAHVPEEKMIVEPPVAVVFETREVLGRIAEVNREPTNTEVSAAARISQEAAEPKIEAAPLMAEAPVRLMTEAPTPAAAEQPELKQVALPIEQAPAVLVQVEEPIPAPITQAPSVQVKSVEPGSLPVKPSSSSEPAAVIVTEKESAVGAATDPGSLAEANPAVLAYLESAKVTGVRASATDPKVLMNNRVYRLEDVVDRDLQLRITGIASRELQFTDARDFVYTKSF